MKQQHLGAIALHPEAHITVNKNRVKQYNQNVYMKANTEYEIELFNPTQDVWMCVIKLDGNPLNDNGFVIKPGQRYWLERYPDEPRKLLFSTYTVDGKNKQVQQAIAKNGLVELDFYREQTLTNSISWTPPTRIDYVNDLLDNTRTDSGTFDISWTATSSNNMLYDANTDFKSSRSSKGLIKASMETGRSEKGSHSNQNFVQVNKSFELYPRHTVTYKLLPESQKPTHMSDIRIYCSTCGRRFRKTDNFCPSCGNKR